MSDIVEKLRAWKQVRTTPYPIGYYLDTGIAAADEIERLLDERAALLKALNKIAERTSSDDPCRELVQIARNACAAIDAAMKERDK